MCLTDTYNSYKKKLKGGGEFFIRVCESQVETGRCFRHKKCFEIPKIDCCYIVGSEKGLNHVKTFLLYLIAQNTFSMAMPQLQCQGGENGKVATCDQTI